MPQDLPPCDRRRLTRAHRRGPLIVVPALFAAALIASSCPVAHADPLTDQQTRVTKALSQVGDDLDEHNAALSTAQDALARSERDLAAARKAVAAASADRKQAQIDDAVKANELTAARAALGTARAAVAVGTANLARQRQVAGAVVRQTSQQNTQLLGVAALVTHLTTGDINEQLQWSTTLFNTTQSHMDALQSAQFRMEAAESAQQAAEQRVETAKAAAAAQVEKTRALEKRAAEAQRAMASRVAANRLAKDAFAAQVAADKKRQADLEREQAGVERKIKARIAAQRGRSSTFAGSGSGYSASAWFDYPVAGPITSPYGMRLHPVLHVWKLHDGTDFGAGCGTEIRAPRDGVVAEEYYNAGYGNRLMIDHGRVDGHYVTTGYNHAQRYIVQVGQQVRRGQVIGYVGTTGFSTGCHLHLMVWQDGTVVDPLAHWF